MIRKTRKLARLLRRAGYRAALVNGVAAAIEHEQFVGSLEIGTLLDVGANKGQFSVLVRELHSNATIHAFEPLREPASRFRQVFRNDTNTLLYEMALSDEPGAATIHVSARPDSSSLLPISNAQSAIFPGTGEKEVREIAVNRGDDILGATELRGPIIIKLDVQGFELSVLRGMPRLLGASSYVYAELSFVELYVGQPLASEVIGWLASKGYALHGIYNLSTSSSGLSIQADFLFKNTQTQFS
jgi:FkbM family methyltransferase